MEPAIPPWLHRRCSIFADPVYWPAQAPFIEIKHKTKTRTLATRLKNQISGYTSTTAFFFTNVILELSFLICPSGSCGSYLSLQQLLPMNAITVCPHLSYYRSFTFPCYRSSTDTLAWKGLAKACSSTVIPSVFIRNKSSASYNSHFLCARSIYVIPLFATLILCRTSRVSNV